MHCVIQINSEFNSPQIIIMVFPTEVLIEGVLNSSGAATYQQYFASLNSQVQSDGMSNVHQLQLSADSIPLDGWCASHPTAAAHSNIAGQLEAFIQQQIPDWPTSTYPVIVKP